MSGRRASGSSRGRRAAAGADRVRGAALLALLALGAGGAGAALVPAAGAAVPPDAIRVGGPSAPSDAKVALVGTREDASGRAFRVLDASGAVVLSGRLSAAPGAPAPWAHAARADLSKLRSPGSYRVRVGALASRPWVVRSGAARKPIATILRYFAANADGSEPSPVHGPAHLDDATIASGPYAGRRFDLTGGWMDAGDMIKFTHTTAYAAAALQAAARLDPADAPALRAAADVGVRWLVKAHPAPDLFVAQVGDARDHDLGFRDPAADAGSAQPGIGRRLAYPSIGGDLGGKAALALALAAERADGAARETLLTQAREWYAAGVAADGVAPRLGDPTGDFYSGDTAEDALAAGAAGLYRVTGEARYRDDAVRSLGQISPDGRLSWNGVAGLAAADLCGALGAPAAPDGAARDAGCTALRAQGRAAAAKARRVAFGSAGDVTWGQTGENGGAGALAALAGRSAGVKSGLAVGAGARDWLLGRNPWGASFVAGFGPRAPRAIHHWASLQGRGQPRGAVVGGPAPLAEIRDQDFGAPRRSPFSTPAATYEDRVEDYVTSEPAIDYAAGSILLLAALADR